jgi:6-methylsalicylate decarboxylase
MEGIQPWSLELHLARMKENRISKSLLSISSPRVSLPGSDATQSAKLARDCNDFAADLKARCSNKFGFRASLSLPDVAATLAEIECSAQLRADGSCILTNCLGRYLADDSLEPGFAELNRRHATIFLHPTTPGWLCTPGGAGAVVSMNAVPQATRCPAPVFEFLFDTARTLIDLFLSGTVSPSPDIHFIVPHLGGTMLPLLSRFTGFSALVPGLSSLTQEEVQIYFQRRLFFDLAEFAFPAQFVGLVDGVCIGDECLLYIPTRWMISAGKFGSYLRISSGTLRLGSSIAVPFLFSVTMITCKATGLEILPLVIDGKNTSSTRSIKFPVHSIEQHKGVVLAESADIEAINRAADASWSPFATRKKTSGVTSRRILLTYANLMKRHEEEVMAAQRLKTSVIEMWARKNVHLAADLVEEVPACITHLGGEIPKCRPPAVPRWRLSRPSVRC